MDTSVLLFFIRSYTMRYPAEIRDPLCKCYFSLLTLIHHLNLAIKSNTNSLPKALKAAIIYMKKSISPSHATEQFYAQTDHWHTKWALDMMKISKDHYLEQINLFKRKITAMKNVSDQEHITAQYLAKNAAHKRFKISKLDNIKFQEISKEFLSKNYVIPTIWTMLKTESPSLIQTTLDQYIAGDCLSFSWAQSTENTPEGSTPNHPVRITQISTSSIEESLSTPLDKSSVHSPPSSPPRVGYRKGRFYRKVSSGKKFYSTQFNVHYTSPTQLKPTSTEDTSHTGLQTPTSRTHHIDVRKELFPEPKQEYIVIPRQAPPEPNDSNTNILKKKFSFKRTKFNQKFFYPKDLQSKETNLSEKEPPEISEPPAINESPKTVYTSSPIGKEDFETVDTLGYLTQLDGTAPTIHSNTTIMEQSTINPDTNNTTHLSTNTTPAKESTNHSINTSADSIPGTTQSNKVLSSVTHVDERTSPHLWTLPDTDETNYIIGDNNAKKMLQLPGGDFKIFSYSKATYKDITIMLSSITTPRPQVQKVIFGLGTFNKASHHKTSLLEVRNLISTAKKIFPKAFFYLPLLTLHDNLTKLETNQRILFNKNLDKLLTPSFRTFTLPPFNKDKFKLTPKDTQGLYWSRHTARLVALTWLMSTHILG